MLLLTRGETYLVGIGDPNESSWFFEFVRNGFALFWLFVWMALFIGLPNSVPYESSPTLLFETNDPWEFPEKSSF